MRPAGKGPLDSLYFTYPEFAAHRVLSTDSVPVAIVGAGPIGMTAALTLASYGIPSVLFDNKTTFNDGSRATCIARPSMQIFQQIGAVAPFLAKALGWTRGRSYFRGAEFFQFEMPHSGNEKYLPMYNLQQQYTEQFLWAAVAAQPLIDLRWASEVTGVTHGSSSARLDVHTPLQDYTLDARFVLAADGARSRLRQHMGLRLQGANYEGRYVIADVQMRHDFPTERRALFEPASRPRGTVLIHKQPDDIWRIDYQLTEEEDSESELQEAVIRTRVAAVMCDIGHTGSWELEWWSIYTANTLALDEYRHGPVLFIGDSAHIVPIFGVRGLNNGIADAHNAGWKLAYVLRGWAEPELLASYTPERRGATLDVFANATKSTRFMTPPTRGWALMRGAALSLALTQDFAKPFANPRQMQPYTYADSPLTLYPEREAAFTAGPVRGAAAVNARLADGGYLLDQTGTGFAALMFGFSSDLRGPILGEVRDQIQELSVELQRRDPRFTTVLIDDRAIMQRYGAEPGSVYLLRPDLHVAGRWMQANKGEILATLDACLGRAPLPHPVSRASDDRKL
jgi:3-(3-hydroxy-phenyl)propionate hydroxylase